MMPEGLLPGRGGLLLVIGVIDGQGGIDIQVQPLPVSRGCPGGPRAGPGVGTRGADTGQMPGVDPLVDQAPHRGRRGGQAEGVFAIAAGLSDTIDAVRPIGDRGGQIGEHVTRRIRPGPAVGIGQYGSDLRR
jgi:hypothetical protein